MRLKNMALLLALMATMSGTLAECTGGGTEKPDPGVVEPPEIEVVEVTEPVDVTNETYGSFWLRCHDYKTMPVGAFNAITAELREDESLYAAYKEAGVNMMIGCWEGISTKALDLCADNGLGYLVCNGNPNANFDAAAIADGIAQAKYHEAFCGVTVSDEPGRVHFDTIAEICDFLDGLMPEMNDGMLWWVNLFPNYANKKQLYFKTYEKSDKLPAFLNKQYPYDRYVSEYMEICKPKVLSYDNYGFHVGLANRGKIREDYFPNLSAIRAAAMESNVPFWHFVQNCRFGEDGFAPSSGELLWVVNTGLSYGAKGIEYFTGVTAFPQYEGAMFDAAGNPTDIYELVKKADAQIAAVDEVLMCCKSKGLIPVGSMPDSRKPETPIAIPESDVIESFGELASCSAKHALIGCFDYNGKTALYITNNSILEADDMTITFGSAVNGYTVVRAERSAFEQATTLTFAPEAGEGMLVVIE